MKQITAIGAALVLALAVGACQSDTAGPTGSTDIPVATSTPAPAAPAPTPTPAAQPGAEPQKVFTLDAYAPSTIAVTYNGEASQARITTYWTSLDDHNTVFDVKEHLVNKGGTVVRAFGMGCIQADADQPGVKEIGGYWFDINQKPFDPRRNPEKISECRNQCVPTWRELEPEFGPWEQYVADDSVQAATVTPKCFKSERRKKTVREQQSCTNTIRVKSETWETREVEIECQCQETGPKDVPGQATWLPSILEGQCEVEVGPQAATQTPALNCHQNGQQQIVQDYVCRADTERTLALCRNVACPTPTPTCANTAAFFKGGANGGIFNLASSSDANELAWVNAHVGLGPWEKFDSEGSKNDSCTGADVAAKVVLVKAGSQQSAGYEYRAYINVSAGQQICSYNPPGPSDGKDISHVSYFRCD